MLNYNKTIAAIVVGATLTAFSPITQADIVINGTRIIYKESDKKITARLENKGSRPLLVQSWLDTGDDNVDPALIKVPFNATPPVSRIDPKKAKPLPSPIPVRRHYRKTGKVCTGLTCWKFHPKCRQKKLKIKMSCNWLSVPVSNCSIALMD